MPLPLTEEQSSTLRAGVEPAPRRDLLHALALMRFVAVIGVCWVHITGSLRIGEGKFDYANAGRFGSAFFTQCAVFLTLLKSFRRTDLDFVPYMTGRFRRVYIPFLLWTGIYLIVQEVKQHFQHSTDPFEISIALLWNGSAYHLWFLPFIFLTGLLLFHLGRFLCAFPKAAIPIAIACIPLGVLCGMHPFTIAPDTFYNTYMPMLAWNRLPSVLWGIFFACIYQFGFAKPLRTLPTLIVGTILFVGSMIMRGLPPEWGIFENLAGAGGMLMGLSILNELSMPWATRLGKLTYGMYLCHLLFVGAIRMACERLWTDQSLAYAIVGTALAVTLSALLSSFLARTRGLKILVPA